MPRPRAERSHRDTCRNLPPCFQEFTGSPRKHGLVTPGSTLFGCWLGRIEPHQMEFAAVEQFPLNGFTGLETDGGRERDGEVNIEAGRGPLSSNGLYF
jgi:hypothetical protein